MYKDEDLRTRILLKTNIDNLMDGVYKEYNFLVKEAKPKVTKKRSHNHMDSQEYHIHVNEEWLT